MDSDTSGRSEDGDDDDEVASALASDFSRARAVAGSDPPRTPDEDDEASEELALPPGGLFTHVKYGTFHVGSTDSSERLGCGKLRTGVYLPVMAWPEASESWCKACAPMAGVHL